MNIIINSKKMKQCTRTKDFILKKVTILDRKNIQPLECTFYDESNRKGNNYIWGLLISRSPSRRFIYAKARATDMRSLIDKLIQKTNCQQRRVNRSTYSKLREDDFLDYSDFSYKNFDPTNADDYFAGSKHYG